MTSVRLLGITQVRPLYGRGIEAIIKHQYKFIVKRGISDIVDGQGGYKRWLHNSIAELDSSCRSMLCAYKMVGLA